MNRVREETYMGIIKSVEEGNRSISSVKFPHKTYYDEFNSLALQYFTEKNDFKILTEIYRNMGNYSAAARCATVYGDKSMMLEMYRLKRDQLK